MYGKQKEQLLVAVVVVYVHCFLVQRAHCKDYALFITFVFVYLLVRRGGTMKQLTEE